MKKQWQSLIFNSQNIEKETARAVLIKLPHSSKFDGWSFWHPKKLIKDAGGKGYFLSLSYTDDWEFKISKGKDLKVITPKDIEEAFNRGHEAFEFAIENTKPYNPIHTPDQLPLNDEISIEEELKDD